MQVPHPPLPRFLLGIEGRLKQDSPLAVLQTLGQHVELFPENSELSAEQRTLLSRALEAIERVVREFGASDESLVIELMTLGKLGRVEEARQRADAAFRAKPSWATAVAVGNALRRAGQLDGAVQAFTAAAKLDQADYSALLEIGDIELEVGHVQQALIAYEAALKRQPAQSWAEVSAWYCRYVLTRDVQWLKLLQQTAATDLDCGELSGLFGTEDAEQRKYRAEDLLGRLRH